MPQQHTHDIRSERGQTMTEFVIVLPFFCLLLFAVMQFGILWNNYVTLTDATRAAARKAAVSRHTSPESEGCTQLRDTATDLEKADDPEVLKCRIDVVGDRDRPGGDVIVTATYPYSIKILDFVVADGVLETKTTERME
jgi:Flp pilus assembly protein TadG